MNGTKLSVVGMFAWLIALVFAFAMALPACAGITKQLHDEVEVNGPTALITGPAKGHWAEENEQPLVFYTVYGGVCEISTWSATATSGQFNLVQGETLCVQPLRPRQWVIWHAETP